MAKILILGAGFGGLETAAGVAAHVADRHEITLVDRSDSFVVGFSKIDVLFGRRGAEQVRYRYADLGIPHVRFVQATITAIDVDARAVATTAGVFAYDYLVVALGADVDPDATPGFGASGGHHFYALAAAERLRPVIEAFTAGTLVLGVLGAPYKCPPAPYEVACQLHALFTAKGIRDRIALKVVIPTARPVPSPDVSAGLERLLAERDIELHAGTPIASVDAAGRKVAIGAATLAYDLFVGVPVHVPPAVVRASRLGEHGFIRPDPISLETAVPNVYAIGDVTTIPAGAVAIPKAGAFAEDAARTVVSDILRKEGIVGEREKFEGRGTCYAEVGDGLIARITANFLGGDAPRMQLEGPLPGLEADKRAFETARRDRYFGRR